MKGISEIIAIVLMLIITVGIAGTAFTYIQGSLLGRTQKQLGIIDVSCQASTGLLYVTVKNLDPQLTVNPATDILVRLDNAPVTLPAGNWSPGTIGSFNSSVATVGCPACSSGTQHSVKIVGPGNQQEKSAYC